MKTVILDNYDSFTFNLYQYVGEIDGRPLVFRNDQISFDELARLRPSGSYFARARAARGPGLFRRLQAGDPANWARRVPLLGVCLGHQGIVHAFGGRIVRASEVMHGKTSSCFHNGSGMFAGVPGTFEAMRYHSLIGEPASLPRLPASDGQDLRTA